MVRARDDSRADSSEAEARAVEPALAREDAEIGSGGVWFREGVDGTVVAVVCENETGDGCSRNDEGHHEGDVDDFPDEDEIPVVAADGVGVEVEGVDFEVEAVEGEGLQEAQDGFGEEVV